MRRPSNWFDESEGLRWCTTRRVSSIIDVVIPTPEHYRRAAAWLRRVADWYDWLATKQRPATETLVGNLRLFVCSRWRHDDPENWQSWRGALLILSPDEQSARDLFAETEGIHEQPGMVECVPGVLGVGEARVIYDDELR